MVNRVNCGCSNGVIDGFSVGGDREKCDTSEKCVKNKCWISGDDSCGDFNEEECDEQNGFWCGNKTECNYDKIEKICNNDNYDECLDCGFVNNFDKLLDLGCTADDINDYCDENPSPGPSPPPPPSGDIPKIGMNIDSTTVTKFNKNLPNLGNWYDDINIPGQIDRKVKMVRVFASGKYNTDLPEIINWCVNNNIYIYLGIYLRGGQDCASIKDRIDYLSGQYYNNKINFDKYVVAISVGNEVYLEKVDSVSLINCGINYCRELIKINKLPNKPITTTFDGGIVNDSYIFREDIQGLLNNLDFISYNTYAWWGGSTIENALLTFKGMIAKIREAMEKQNINKELWVAETGWPHALNNKEDERNNKKNAIKHYKEIIDLFSNDKFTFNGKNYDIPDKLFYFSYNDTQGVGWGLEETYKF